MRTESVLICLLVYVYYNPRSLVRKAFHASIQATMAVQEDESWAETMDQGMGLGRRIERLIKRITHI